MTYYWLFHHEKGSNPEKAALGIHFLLLLQNYHLVHWLKTSKTNFILPGFIFVLGYITMQSVLHYIQRFYIAVLEIRNPKWVA